MMLTSDRNALLEANIHEIREKTCERERSTLINAETIYGNDGRQSALDCQEKDII